MVAMMQWEGDLVMLHSSPPAGTNSPHPPIAHRRDSRQGLLLFIDLFGAARSAPGGWSSRSGKGGKQIAVRDLLRRRVVDRLRCPRVERHFDKSSDFSRPRELKADENSAEY